MASGTVADSTTNYDVEMSMVASGLPGRTSTSPRRATSTQTIDRCSASAPTVTYTTRQTITSFDYAVTTGDGTPTDFDELEHGRRLGHATSRRSSISPSLLSTPPAGDLASLELDPASTQTLTAEQGELIDVFAESGFGMDGFGAMFPATPVGQGRRVDGERGRQPVRAASVPLTLRFTLVSLKGDDYTHRVRPSKATPSTTSRHKRSPRGQRSPAT